jgi:uncharacterized membrane protein
MRNTFCENGLGSVEEMARRSFLLVLGLAFLFGTSRALAAAPKVRALLFYNPACPHCQFVMNTVLPPLATQYDRQLEILPVNVTTTQGEALYQAVLVKYAISPENQVVPILLISDTLLIGSDEIAGKLPGVIETKLKSGGTDYPALTGMDDYLKSQGATPVTSQQPLSFPQTFYADQPANSVAVVVLIFLCASLIFSILGAFVGIPAFLKNFPAWVFPVSILIGMGIAGYLSFTETTNTEVACGVIGHCNAVQNSQYAKILGFLPLGVFGLAGYLSIGAAWLIFIFTRDIPRAIASIAMYGFGVFGLSFSIYLTFLEPFVIGATCLWCLGSATVLGLVLPQTVNGVRETIERYGHHLTGLPSRMS